jgi:hypothetical protein
MNSSRDTTFNNYLPCLICGTHIVPTCGKAVPFLPCTHKTNADHSSFDGVVGTISAGYGSKYDTDTFTLALCDNCIKKNLGRRIFEIGSYMPPGTPQYLVDNLIDSWHDDRSKPRHKLNEWLKLNEQEYAAFVEGTLSYEEVWRLYNERTA